MGGEEEEEAGGLAVVVGWVGYTATLAALIIFSFSFIFFFFSVLFSLLFSLIVFPLLSVLIIDGLCC